VRKTIGGLTLAIQALVLTFGGLALALLLVQAATATAQKAPSQEDRCLLRVATGSKGQGNSAAFADMKATCPEIPMCEAETKAGLANLYGLLTNMVELGFVHQDTLIWSKKDDPKVADLKAVVRAGSALLHIVARREPRRENGATLLPRLFGSLFGAETKVVTNLSQLRGSRVAVVGSARDLVARLNRSLGLGLRVVDRDYSDAEAIAALKSNTIAALFTMNRWPFKALESEIQRDPSLRLINYDLPATESHFSIQRRRYTSVSVETFNFLAVESLLVTRVPADSGWLATQVAALQRCLVSRKTELETRRDASTDWSLIHDLTDVEGWGVFGATRASTPVAPPR